MEEKKNEELTTSTHIYLAFATACLTFLLVVMPSVTKLPIGGFLQYLPILLTIFIVVILLPSIIMHKKLYKGHILGEDDFALMKILAVIVAILARKCFIFYYAYQGDISKDSWFYLLFTIVLVVLLSANIIEAVYNQIDDREKPLFNGDKSNSDLNMSNAAIGIFITLLLFVMVFKGHRFNVINDNITLQASTKLGIWWILAYSLWNMVFVMQTGGIPTFMFFCATIVLPIITEYTGTCDWLEARGLSLLFFIILMMGMGKGESNIFPMYNKLDEEYENTDFQDNLTKVDYNEELKITMLVCAFICSAVACYKIFY